MMSNYHAPMLNDLHNYFPEILYNPVRFQTTQDLIQYIIQVANENPYLRGQAQYNYQRQHALSAQQSAPLSQPQPLQPQPLPAYSPRAEPQERVYRAARISRFAADDDRSCFNILYAAPQGSSPLRQDGFISNLLGQILYGMPPLENFLDPVIVHPSAEQIEEATSVETALVTQDDNCAICQEEIGEEQEMRTIDHCHHTFHQHCIDIWFQRNVRCPTCRHDIRDF